MCNQCKLSSGSGIIRGNIRISESHVGFRFGDHTSKEEGIQWIVLLDGIDVTYQCSEAVAGLNGAVVIIKDLKSSLPDNYFLVTGNVEVRTEEWKEANV